MKHTLTEAERNLIAKQQLERALRQRMEFCDTQERARTLIFYLQGRFNLDAMLVERFLGHPVFSQQFDGSDAVEVAQHTLIAANKDDRPVFEFALYSNVGDELRTGGGAAPACTLRRVA